MKVIVCVKIVPWLGLREIDLKIGEPLMINPADREALEAAKEIKKRNRCKVITVTVGPKKSKDVVKRVLSMGAEEAYLVEARENDFYPRTTACLLKKIIEKIGYDIVLCGEMSLDWRNSQVNSSLAHMLKIPFLNFVDRLKLDGKNVLVRQVFENRAVWLKAKVPVLLTVKKNVFKPQLPTAWQIAEAFKKKKVRVFKPSDLGVDPDLLEKSRYIVKKAHFPLERRQKAIKNLEEASAFILEQVYRFKSGS